MNLEKNQIFPGLSSKTPKGVQLSGCPYQDHFITMAKDSHMKLIYAMYFISRYQFVSVK
jgi:hypothetical protein